MPPPNIDDVLAELGPPPAPNIDDVLVDLGPPPTTTGKEGVGGYHSFAVGAGSGAVKAFAETGRGLYEAANRKSYLIPNNATPTPFGNMSMREATPEERIAIDAHNARVAETARSFYDPTIEAMRSRINTMSEYNPASTKAGNIVGTVVPSLAAAATGVAAPAILGAQIGGITLGEARARGIDWEPASGQAALMTGVGALTGGLAGPAFQVAKVAAPFSSPSLNLLARGASTYAVGQGIGAGFSAAGELGPMGGGDPWGAAVETVNEPAVIGMSGLPTFGVRRFNSPWEAARSKLPEMREARTRALEIAEAERLQAIRDAADPLMLGSSAPNFDASKVQISTPRSIGEVAGLETLQPIQQQSPSFGGLSVTEGKSTVVPERTIVPETPASSGGIPLSQSGTTEVPVTKMPETPKSSGGIPLSQSGTTEVPVTKMPETPKSSGGIPLSQSGEAIPVTKETGSTVPPKSKPTKLKVSAIYEGEPIQGEYLGDTISGGARIGIQGGHEVVVNKNTMQVLSEEPSRARSISRSVEEPISTEVKTTPEIPSLAGEVSSINPITLMPRNRSRSGAIPTGGPIGQAPSGSLAKSIAAEYLSAGKTVSKQAARIGRALGKAALAPVDAALWAGRFTTQDLYQKMERNPKLAETADRFKQMQADTGDMLRHPDARAALREVEYSPLERSALNKASAAPEMPSSGIHAADSKFYQWLTGAKDITTAPAAIQRVVRAWWKANRVSLGFGKGVEGVNQGGFPEGKGVVHFFSDSFTRELQNLPKAEGDAIIKATLADRNGMTVEQARNALGEMGLLEAPNSAIVRRNPIEVRRVFKKVPSHLSINGRVLEVLDLDPRIGVRRTLQTAAARVAFIKKMGAKLDPSMSDAQLKELLPTLDSSEVSLLRKAIQEWHGIESGIDASIRSGAKKVSEFAKTGETPAAQAMRVVGDAISQTGRGALNILSAAALTASQPGNIASTIPGAASVVGPVNAGIGLLRYAKSAKGNKSKLVENGIIPELVDRMGRADIIEQSTRLVDEVLAKVSRPIDRQTAMLAGHSGMAFVDSLRNPPGFLAKATASFKRGADLAILKNLNYSDSMAQRLVSGKGTEAEYHQVVRDVIEAVTGQGGDMLSKSPEQRIRSIPQLFYFMKYPTAQLRGMVRIMDNSMRSARKGDIAGAAHGVGQATTKALGLTASGAATGLALAALGGSAGQLLEKPMALLWEGLWRGWWGGAMQSASTILGLTGDGRTRGPVETLAQASFPVGLAYNATKAVVDARKSRVGDEILNLAPLIDFAYTRVPGARRVRDFIGLQSSIDTGAKLEPERRATTAFYEFARKNPEFMSQEIDPNFTQEVTPLYDAVRRVASMKGIDPEKLRRALVAAGLEGKTAKDVAEKLRNKRMTHRFKGGEMSRPAFINAFAQDHGYEAAREILLHDMRMDALADILDPP